jgi:hypothetical protein
MNIYTRIIFNFYITFNLFEIFMSECGSVV